MSPTLTGFSGPFIAAAISSTPVITTSSDTILEFFKYPYCSFAPDHSFDQFQL